jgi:hypothetical protein
MTFDELALEISRNVWPEGESRALRSAHKNLIRDGLIDLQKKIPCLQTQNIDYIRHGATFFYCGASAFVVPTGYVRSLRTIPDLQATYHWRQCDSVWAQPQSREEFECILSNAAQCGESLTNCGCANPIEMPYGYYCGVDFAYPAYGAYEYPAYGPYPPYSFPGFPAYGYAGVWVPYPDLPMGLMYADAITDKGCRARERWFAMFNCYIYTYPVINSDEVLILEWHGIKRNWEDEDVIPYLDEDGGVNRQIVQALEYYVACEHVLRFDCEDDRSKLQRSKYDQLVRELILDCREQNRLPSRQHCFVDCNC